MKETLVFFSPVLTIPAFTIHCGTLAYLVPLLREPHYSSDRALSVNVTPTELLVASSAPVGRKLRFNWREKLSSCKPPGPCPPRDEDKPSHDGQSGRGMRSTRVRVPVTVPAPYVRYSLPCRS